MKDEVLGQLARAAQLVRMHRKNQLLRQRAAAAQRALRVASLHLAPVAPDLRVQAVQLLAELEANLPSPEVGDRWAVVREVVTLRAAGTPTHAVARQLIKAGACKGTGKPAEVAACVTWMRKERHRWRQATVTAPKP